MSSIVDKRSYPKDKQAVNRQKFLDKYKKVIKQAVKESIDKSNIKDFSFRGKKITIKAKDDLDLPEVHFSEESLQKGVLVGNKKFKKGDMISKPKGVGRGAGGSDSGESDNFSFQLTEDEYAKLFFEDLELPNMVKEKLCAQTFEIQKCGYTTRGDPCSLSIKRTITNAIARQISLLKKHKKSLVNFLDKKLLKQYKINFLEDIDLRYNYRTKVEVPSTKAVMFCMMDVSGSMEEFQKDIAKRFYILLYLFLRQNYDNVEVVFIRHTSEAEECSQEKFFYDPATGGTIISSGYKLINEIIPKRFNPESWNIYVAQASDGDTWGDDYEMESELYKLLPITQYFSYINIGIAASKLSKTSAYYILDKLSITFKNLVCKIVHDAGEIYPVFRSLFERKN